MIYTLLEEDGGLPLVLEWQLDVLDKLLLVTLYYLICSYLLHLIDLLLNMFLVIMINAFYVLLTEIIEAYAD